METLRRTEDGGYEEREERFDSRKVRRCQRSFSNSLPPSSPFLPSQCVHSGFLYYQAKIQHIHVPNLSSAHCGFNQYAEIQNLK